MRPHVRAGLSCGQVADEVRSRRRQLFADEGACAAYLGASTESLRKQECRKRNEGGMHPKEPARHQASRFIPDDAKLPQRFATRQWIPVLDGEHAPKAPGHLVLQTERQRQGALARPTAHVYMVGTFDIVAPPFKQLLTVSIRVSSTTAIDGKTPHKAAPVGFALMSSMTTHDYMRVLKVLIPGALRPAVVHVDFEAALWTCARDIFGSEQDILGCSFHMAQAVTRRACGKGELRKEYVRDPNVRKWVKCYAALPFVDAKWVLDLAESLEQNQPSSDAEVLRKTKQFSDYSKSTWLVGNGPGFQIKSWCAYGHAERTNNRAEGFHRRLQARYKKANGPYKLAKLLEEEAEKAVTTFDQALANMPLVGRRDAARDYECKIQRRWQKYEDGVKGYQQAHELMVEFANDLPVDDYGSCNLLCFAGRESKHRQ